MSFKQHQIIGEFAIWDNSKLDEISTNPLVHTYIGQSVDIPQRWHKYLMAVTYPRSKSDVCLRRVKFSLRSHTVIMRTLATGLSRESLNPAERCAIAMLKPDLNKVTFGHDLTYCDVPLTYSKSKYSLSGIYQLLVIPKTLLPVPLGIFLSKDVTTSIGALLSRGKYSAFSFNRKVTRLEYEASLNS